MHAVRVCVGGGGAGGYLRLVRLVMSEIAISPTAQMKFILSSTANDAATNQFYNLMHSKTWGEGGGGGGNNLPQPMQQGRIPARFTCTNDFELPRQLGFGPAISSLLRFDFGEGPIWLDEASCTGQEEALSECPHAGWANHDCSHASDAGVRCSGWCAAKLKQL